MWTSSEHDEVSDQEIIWQMHHGLPANTPSSEQLERILGFGNGHTLAQLNSHLDSLADAGGFNGHDVYDDFDY